MMKTIWLVIGLVIFPSAMAIAETPVDYEIVVVGNDLAEINQVKNCIDYTVCEYASNILERNQQYSKMTIHVKLDRAELKQVSEKCVIPYQSEFSMTVRRAGASHSLDLNPAQSILFSTAERWNQNPLYVKNFSRDENEMQLSAITRMIERRRYTEAMIYASQVYELDFNGYALRYNPRKKDAEYALSDHQEKVVQIGHNFFETACDLMVGLRHEAEHVYQMKRESECRAMKKVSAFQDHLYRERSAYLNDIYNVRRYCNDSKVIQDEERFRYRYLFHHYGPGANLN